MFKRQTAAVKKTVLLNKPQYEIQFVQEGLGLLEGDQPFRAAVGFVSFGAIQSAVYEAMTLFQKIKFPAACFYLNSLVPFPAGALEAFAERVDKIVVVETDVKALVSKMLREKTWIRPIKMVPPQGGSITAQDIFEKEDWT